MKVQKSLSPKDYTVNVISMTNLELLRERESVSSLVHNVKTQYPFWRDRSLVVEKELLKRSLKPINGN
jgi:hypothetical protein